ncbi:MAG: hypothetical protein RQ847_12045, partial [Wenzhouxiangellaceae bacterium]|nr:hypothetical protein [Wenzhouxiangellaceae bacterium]
FSLEANLNHALARGRIEDSLLLALALSSFCGGLIGGMMAALLGGGRAPGIATGALIAASNLLLMTLSAGAFGALQVMAGLPLVGAIVGSGLAVRLHPSGQR